MAAEVIVLRCEVRVLGSSEVTQRLIQIDTDDRSVRDNSLRWQDGGVNPLFSNDRQQVEVGENAVRWGDVTADRGERISRFTLDLQHGTYAYDGSIQPLARGSCTRSEPAS